MMSATMPPVMTETTRCQDCARCLRACPVAAISMSGGHARIRPEACIACGRCVTACPTGSQRIRDDLPRVQAWCAAGPVVASLAPSWPAAFPGVAPAQMATALRGLGFRHASPTAVGARSVSAAMDVLATDAPHRLWLSSACPAVTAWVRRHRPALVPALAPVASPAAVHARMLHRVLPGCRVVLIAPCIAKKLEADEGPDLAAALTFADLDRWFGAAGVDPRTIVADIDAAWLLGSGGAGESYAHEGGMAATLARPAVACSDIATLDRWLAGADPERAGTVVEALACAGGCIHGPGMHGDGGILVRRARVQAARDPSPIEPQSPVPTGAAWRAAAEPVAEIGEREVAAALATLGKRTKEDELDCGACGYDTCRGLARAITLGRAESDQCVAWMRRLAQRKANALLEAMPAGAVLVDHDLRIIEANRRFAELVGHGGPLTGLALGEVAPIVHPFRHVLDGLGDLVERDLRVGERVLHGSVFTIDPGRVVGAVLVDRTVPAMSRAQVAQRAGEALAKHLTAVQQIAWLLGENAAEVETLLGSIVDAYRSPDGDDA